MYRVIVVAPKVHIYCISLYLDAHVYRYLMVHPRDFRVVIVECLLCPAHFRNTLARVLFNHFNVNDTSVVMYKYCTSP